LTELLRAEEKERERMLDSISAQFFELEKELERLEERKQALIKQIETGEK